MLNEMTVRDHTRNLCDIIELEGLFLLNDKNKIPTSLTPSFVGLTPVWCLLTDSSLKLVFRYVGERKPLILTVSVGIVLLFRSILELDVLKGVRGFQTSGHPLVCDEQVETESSR